MRMCDWVVWLFNQIGSGIAFFLCRCLSFQMPLINGRWGEIEFRTGSRTSRHYLSFHWKLLCSEINVITFHINCHYLLHSQRVEECVLKVPCSWNGWKWNEPGFTEVISTARMDNEMSKEKISSTNINFMQTKRHNLFFREVDPYSLDVWCSMNEGSNKICTKWDKTQMTEAINFQTNKRTEKNLFRWRCNRVFDYILAKYQRVERNKWRSHLAYRGIFTLLHVLVC